MPRPSRPWFRFYVEAVHDRKLRRLKPEQRWLFVACLAAARQSCEPGALMVGDDDPMTTDDIMDFAGMSRSAVVTGMQALINVGVIDLDESCPPYRFVVPAWSERQYESDDVTARTRKHRLERSNDVPGNVPETAVGTPPETEADTETDSPLPPDRVTQIVDAVFVKVLADKQQAGDAIRSVDGFRKWWEANEAEGCRKRAAWFLEHYDMPSIGHYADATRSPSVPRWAKLREVTAQDGAA